MTETLAHGTYLRVLRESYPTNTNMTGFSSFKGYLRPCSLDEGSLRIGRVKTVVRLLEYSYLFAL